MWIFFSFFPLASEVEVKQDTSSSAAVLSTATTGGTTTCTSTSLSPMEDDKGEGDAPRTLSNEQEEKEEKKQVDSNKQRGAVENENEEVTHSQCNGFNSAYETFLKDGKSDNTRREGGSDNNTDSEKTSPEESKSVKREASAKSDEGPDIKRTKKDEGVVAADKEREGEGRQEEPRMKGAFDKEVASSAVGSEKNCETASVALPSSAEGSRLLSPGPKESKVTISPVRGKVDNSGGGGGGGSSMKAERPGSLGSVTITKLSTGTSQCVESKDLKTVLAGGAGGSNNSGSSQKEANGMNNCKRPVKKSPNSYSVEVQKKKERRRQDRSQEKGDAASGEESSGYRCQATCKQLFATKEARHLHTCNSKLDEHFLTEAPYRKDQEGSRGGGGGSDKSSVPTSAASSPASTLSHGSSRSSSPTSFAHSGGGGGGANVQPNCASNSDQKDKPSANHLPGGGEVKLIEDEKRHHLMIEGRPKLTISKVSSKTIDMKTGAGFASSTSSTATSASMAQCPPAATTPKIVAKLKLPPSTTATATATATDTSNHDPYGFPDEGGDEEGGKISLKRKISSPGRGGNMSGSSSSSEQAFSAKLKIKLPANVSQSVSMKVPVPLGSGGSSSNSSTSSNGGGGPPPMCGGGPGVMPGAHGGPHLPHGGRRPDEEGAAGAQGVYSFPFAGKPTYSPSRVEPSSNPPGKGEELRVFAQQFS